MSDDNAEVTGQTFLPRLLKYSGENKRHLHGGRGTETRVASV